MSNRNMRQQLAGIKPTPIAFFDALRFAITHPPAEAQIARLIKHAQFVTVRPNTWPRDWETILTIVVPDAHALQTLAAMPGLIPREVEIALDLTVEKADDARVLHALIDAHFVQPWHGKQEVEHTWGTTYTGKKKPGHRFVAYSDRRSKIRDAPCLHFEGRYQGAAALGAIGIGHPRDLLSFDHTAFWRKNLRLFAVDRTRLGRWHDNRLTGARRQQVRQRQSGKFIFNEDRASGSLLFRVLGAHSTGPEITVQRFVDQYGRGSYLSAIDVSVWLPR
jgi:hypothetical protein